MNTPVSTLRADLSEKIVAARSYGLAQQALMQAIVDQRLPHIVNHGLDLARIAAAIFRGTSPESTRVEEDLTPQLIEGTAEFLGLYAYIKQTEKLLNEWLQSTVRKDVSPILQHVDRVLGMEGDPRFDLYVVAGREADEVARHLRDRGYSRVLEWQQICGANDSTTLDAKRTEAALDGISDLSSCRPGRVWLLWGEGAECPESARASLDEQLRKAFMNRNTVGSLGERWSRQFIANIPALARRGRNLGDLTNAFAGSGAVIVGAGPSLDEGIAWIRGQKVKPLVICSYKAVRALVQGGVTPDLIVMLDPKQGLHHLADLDLSGTAAIVSEVAVDPAALSANDIPILPYCSGTDTHNLVAALGSFEVPIIRSGGSVLHIALQIARLIGCARVTFAGVDFGFPNERLYANGAGQGDELILADDRRSYVRRAVDGNHRSGMLVGAVANDGTVIATTVELNHYRAWTEQFVRDSKRHGLNTDFFNASRMGARIEGVEFVADLATHVISTVSVDAERVIDHLSALVGAAEVEKPVAMRLREKAQKLRALSRTCRKAATVARDEKATDTKIYGRVAEQAEDCPEVSLALTRNLQIIDEQMKRSTVDAPQRLRELAAVTGEEAQRIAALYSSAAQRLRRRVSAQEK